MTPRLRAITTRSYRCFAEPFRLRLAPLTLVYGWNNSGKSAAVRLVGILADSLRETARAVLDLTGEAGGKASFDRVQWKGLHETEPRGVWLTLEWSGAELRKVQYRLDHHADWRRIYVRELEIFDDTGSDDDPVLRVEARSDEGQHRFELTRRGRATEPTTELHFTGLVPRHADPILSTLQRQLSALRGHIQWMGASRVAPPSSIPQDAPPPVQLEPNGEGCVEKLLANRELFEDVARWYALPEIHRDLRFRPDGTRQRLLLNPMGTSFDIDLADTGSGMGQVLPILTGVALGRASTVSGQAGPGSGMQQSASRAAQSSLLPARSPKS